jgi:hypothetical protein
MLRPLHLPLGRVHADGEGGSANEARLADAALVRTHHVGILSIEGFPIKLL